MLVIHDEIDGSYYVDLAVNSKELQRVERGEIVSAAKIMGDKIIYFGIRIRGTWDNEEEIEGTKEDQKSF